MPMPKEFSGGGDPVSVLDRPPASEEAKKKKFKKSNKKGKILIFPVR
jgi:hypothetical protein